jgi:bifunctional DNA-binding transcriptional regulator/antitoxin component of YhaV-PrlF toxin-antitoxin module
MALSEICTAQGVFFLPLGKDYIDIDLEKLKHVRLHNAAAGTRFIVTEYEQNIFGKKINPQSSLATCSPADLLETTRQFYRKMDSIVVPAIAFSREELFSKKIEGKSLWLELVEDIWPEVKDIVVYLEQKKEGVTEALFRKSEELEKRISQGSFPSHENLYFKMGRLAAQFHDCGIDIDFNEIERRLEHYIEDKDGKIWMVDIDPQQVRFLPEISTERRKEYLGQNMANFERSKILWKQTEKTAYVEGYLSGAGVSQKGKEAIKLILE